MNTKPPMIKTLKGVGSCLILAGSLWAVNGWAQTANAEGSEEADDTSLLDALNQPSQADTNAAQQALGWANQQRRVLKQARRQATFEQMRAAKLEPSSKLETLSKEEAPSKQVVPQKLEVSQKLAAPTIAALADIDVSFKLDQELPTGFLSSDGWAAPPINAVNQEGEFTVEARVQGRDPSGQPVDIIPEWKAADPTVQISPLKSGGVKITVRGSGESNLTVTALGFSKDLWISATEEGKAIQVRISQ